MKNNKSVFWVLVVIILTFSGGYTLWKKEALFNEKKVTAPRRGNKKIPEPAKAPAHIDFLAKTAWPVFQGDARHTGRSPFKGRDGLKQMWALELNSLAEASSVIGIEGSLYVGTYDSSFYSISPSGKVQWKFETRGPVRGTAAISGDGTIYVASRDGALYAIEKGKAKWIKVLSDKSVDSSPVVSEEGTIYIGSHNGYLYAVNQEGTLKWKSEPLGHISASSPALGDEATIYIGSYDGNLYALDENTGHIKWKYRTSSGIRTSPAIDDKGTIYIGSRDGIVYAVTKDGKLKWKFKSKSDIRAPLAISWDGVVLFGSWDGNLYALSPQGRLLWKYDTGKPVEGPVSTDAAGNIYFTSLTGHLYVLSSKGKLKQKLPTFTFIHGAPVIDSDGTVYLVAGTRLFAFGRPLPLLHISMERSEFSTGESINMSVQVDSQGSEEEEFNLKVWLEFIESGQKKIVSMLDKLISASSVMSEIEIKINPFIQENQLGLYKLKGRLASPVTGEEIDFKETYFYRYADKEKGSKSVSVYSKGEKK